MYLLKNLTHLMQSSKPAINKSELGRKINVDRKLIGSWFDSRQGMPQTPELKKLSDLFKVSIDYLCMEDLTLLSKEEILDNYNLIQKRLQHGKQ